MRHFFVLAALSGSLMLRPAAAQEMEAAPTSQLAGVALPAKTLRVRPQNVPKEITDALAKVIVAGGDKVKQGRNEVLAWTGKTYKPALVKGIKAQLEKAVEADGWTYNENAPEPGADGTTLMTVLRTVPTRKALIGIWAPSNEALVLAWTEMLPNVAAQTTPEVKPAPSPAIPTKPIVTPTNPTTAPAGEIVVNVAADARYVNVMKGTTPKIPTFPTLTAKPGFVRGYVKDWNGKPLANARLGVRSTAVGGAYTGSSGKTDEKGYYEFAVPFGVAHFYAGAYTVDWGEGRAALGLHPADGELDGFASNVGGVENFVLLPFGIANRDKVSENPQYSGNYYGGSFTIGYDIFEGGDFNQQGLPMNSQVEITLTPQGTLFSGEKGQTIVLRKQVEAGGYHYFYVNNIPLGTYEISATLNGAPLNMRETGPYANQEFGLDPKKAQGKATLLFRPNGAQAEITIPQSGNWRELNVTLER